MTAKRYKTKIDGKTRLVTIPEDPKPEDILADALREDLSPQAAATIVAYLQPVRVADQKVERQVAWFSDLLTTLVGGPEQLNTLFEEVGL